MSEYTMRDLGYPRTPTDAMLRVEMPDGTRWDVPVQLIADSRDYFYAGDSEDTIGFVRKGDLDRYDLEDWAAGEMNWSEAREFAIPVVTQIKPVDYQIGWVNGEKQIVGEI